MLVMMFLAVSCGDDTRYGASSTDQDPNRPTENPSNDPDDPSNNPDDPSNDTEDPGDVPDVAEEPSGPGCLELSDDTIDFGAVLQDEEVIRSLHVSNCSEKPITISEIVLDSDANYTLIDTEPFHTLEAGASGSIGVAFRPSDGREEPRHGRLTIRHDARPGASEEVQLVGMGNLCPVAEIRASVVGEEREVSGQIRASLGDTIVLDGEDSFDPGHEDEVNSGIGSLEWVVLNAPEGSALRLTPSNRVVSPRFTAVVPGFYALELRVTDQHNALNCNRARIGINIAERGPDLLAPQGDDIEVRLTWARDDSDMDLHFLNASQPEARWNAAPWDCHWRNPVPNWGDLARSDDNPSQDIDNTQGFGPEWTRLNHPEDNGVYRVGAYYHGSSLGPSHATIAVWSGGELLYESTTSRPIAQGEFWQPAVISWGLVPEVIAVETYSHGFPE